MPTRQTTGAPKHLWSGHVVAQGTSLARSESKIAKTRGTHLVPRPLRVCYQRRVRYHTYTQLEEDPLSLDTRDKLLHSSRFVVIIGFHCQGSAGLLATKHPLARSVHDSPHRCKTPGPDRRQGMSHPILTRATPYPKPLALLAPVSSCFSP